jgi:hypothetical protein
MKLKIEILKQFNKNKASRAIVDSDVNKRIIKPRQKTQNITNDPYSFLNKSYVQPKSSSLEFPNDHCEVPNNGKMKLKKVQKIRNCYTKHF